MTKLLLIGIALFGLAESVAGNRADPPLLIDNGTAPTTLDAHR